MYLESGRMRAVINAIYTFSCVCLLFTNNIAVGKRILVVTVSPWYSHQQVFRLLCMALNKRGHELVVVTSSPMRDPTLENYTEINIPTVLKFVRENFDETKPLNLPPLELFERLLKLINILNANLFNEPGFANLYRHDNNEKFDAVIAEAVGGPSYFALAYRFNVPLIGVMTVGIHNYHRYLFGGPLVTSHPSNWELGVAEDPPSIWQKLWNFINTWRHLYFWVNEYMVAEQEIIKKHFGNDVPNLIDIIRNMTVLLVNENPAYGYVKPEQPNAVFFSGLHINKTAPPPLPRDLKLFLDNATEGFIYVSFGTTVSWNMLPKETLEIFVEVFSKLPYKIVMKFNSDIWSNRKLDNAFISQWFPQQGVLAHPNIKLYIYQGGLQSTEEAVYYAVPLLGIPIIFDQHSRVQRLASLGVAIHFKINELTKETLDTAIRRILGDKSYKEKMIHLSSIVKDQPYDNMENAIWWIEYAMKHKERLHYFRFSEIDKPWYQRYDMDIIALLATTLFVIMGSILLIIFRILRFIFKQYCSPRNLRF